VFSAAILAGGKATRFDGRDKSALLVDGQTILLRQIAVLSDVAPDLTRDLMLVGGAARAGVPDSVRQVPDLVPGCGPLSGVHAALSAARSSVVIILACDMPFVSAPLLRHLLSLTRDAGERATAGPDVVVPQTERGYHPLCAVYTHACLEPAARLLAGGRFKLTALFDEVRVRVVTADALAAFGDPNRLLANVNTSLEYRAIEANGMQS
jgi:molybdopterin-guanine dinucleotide biosynthesis protein A